MKLRFATLSLILVLLGVLPAELRAQGAGYHDTAWKFSAVGTFPATGATITVCPSTSSGIPCAPVAAVYLDKALTQPCLPSTIGCLTADGKGNFSFYVAPGDYIYTVTGTGITGYGPVPFSLGIIASGNNTLGGNNAFTGRNTMGNFNDVLVIDGVQYATCAAAITAAGAVNKTIILVPSTYAGAECPTSTSVNGILQVVTTPNITIWDFRGGNVGHNLDFNSNSQDPGNAIQTRLSVMNYNSALNTSWTSSAILGTNIHTGNVPNKTLAGITSEMDFTGALGTIGTGVIHSIEADVAIRSTGGTIPFIQALRAASFFDWASATTNVTTGVGLSGACMSAGVSAQTVLNCYGIVAEASNQAGIGTSRNYSLFNSSKAAWVSGFGIDLFDTSDLTNGVTHPFLGFNSGPGQNNLTISSPSAGGTGVSIQLLNTAGTKTNWLYGSNVILNNCFEITPSTTAGGTTFTTPGFSACNNGAGGPVTVNVPGALTVGGTPVAGSGFTGVNVTPVTVNANTAADQNGMAMTITAGALNSVSRTLLIQLAGVYSTPAASTTTLTHKLKLCTVSGCGSGTVLTLATWTTSALGGIQVTNDPYNVVLNSSTQTAGASAAFEAHGNLTIDLAALTSAAENVFADNNTATVGTIDSTAQLFLQHTIAFSAASASNSATDRQMIADTVD